LIQREAHRADFHRVGLDSIHASTCTSAFSVGDRVHASTCTSAFSVGDRVHASTCTSAFSVGDRVHASTCTSPFVVFHLRHCVFCYTTCHWFSVLGYPNLELCHYADAVTATPHAIGSACLGILTVNSATTLMTSLLHHMPLVQCAWVS
jgi:hypothetical protein